MTDKPDVSVILLAGGKGERMNDPLPKQYHTIREKPIFQYSLDLFLQMPEVMEVIVVCDPLYRNYFNNDANTTPLRFADPGKRRQDSMWNGFQACSPTAQLICIHDAVRPLIDCALVQRAISAARQHGAATAGMPIKFTVKESQDDYFVVRTPDRKHVWEIQTPQVLKPYLLKVGYDIAQQTGITVTDDVTLVELFGHPVKLVEGSHANLKITTLEDLLLAERLLEKRYSEPQPLQV